MKPDVVIVGGGLGGLACAALLGKKGARALVIERKELGGRARSHEQEGFTFDQGPHAVYRAGPAEETLRELGVAIVGRSPKVEGSLLFADDGLHPMPVGLGSLLASDFSARAKLEIAMFMARMRPKDPARTIEQFVSETFITKEARKFAHALIRLTTYTNAPDLLRAGFAIERVAHVSKHDVLYLDGGWQTLVDALLDGARVLTGDPKIEPDLTVHLGEQIFRPAHVILAVAPRSARALAPWESIVVKDPVCASILQVGLRELPRPERRFALGVDQPLYYAVPSATAKLAPEGAHAINVAKYLRVGTDERATEEELARALDVIQPGWREHQITRRFLPRMIVANAVPGEGHPPARTENLHFVGDWVPRDQSLLDAVMASARAAVDRICRSKERSHAA